MRKADNNGTFPLLDYAFRQRFPLCERQHVAPASVTVLDDPVAESTRMPLTHIEVPHTPVKGSSRISELLPIFEHHLRSSNKRPLTVLGFVSDMRLFHQLTGDPRAGDVTHVMVDYYLSSLQKTQKEKTVHRKLTSLRSFFRWLFKEGALEHDPTASLKFDKPDPPLPIVLTSAEMDRLILASAASPEDHVLTLLLLGAGLKRGELAALKIGDIDISNALHPVVTISPMDRHRKREVVLPCDFVPSYKQYLAGRGKYHAADFVIICTSRNTNMRLRAIGDRAGIHKQVSCQILRDTFAVHALKAGEEIEDVLGWLGLSKSAENVDARYRFNRLMEITA